MKRLIISALPITSVLVLTQCAQLNKVQDWIPGGATSVTKQTEGSDYYDGKLRQGNLNSIAAKVDGSVVTRNELNFMLSPIRKQLAAQFPRRGSQYSGEMSKAKDQVFQELIDRELILNEFSTIGGVIPPREIDREINNRIQRLYSGKRSLYLTDLRKNGLSQAKYRNLVERTIAVGAMKAQHLNDFAPPTTDELQKEYNKFSDKLRDISKDKAAYKKIWIPAKSNDLGSTPESQLELAEDLAKRIRKGESFSKLAKEHSSDAYASDGGQWPLTPRMDFPVHFAPIVFKEPIGKIIGPLADKHGFHIIKVTQRINGPSPVLSKVRTQLEQRVIADKSAARFKRWIERLRNNADIVRY